MITVVGDQPRGCANTARATSTAYVRRGSGSERGLVYLSGELDLATADRVAAELVRAVATIGPDITVDLSGVTFCDARGLAALVKAADRAGRDGGAITLRGDSPMLARLLWITGLEHRFSTGRPAPARTEPEASAGDLRSPGPAHRGERGGDAGERTDDEGRRQRLSGRGASGRRAAAA